MDSSSWRGIGPTLPRAWPPPTTIGWTICARTSPRSRKAGVSENFLGVSFGEEGGWPSEADAAWRSGIGQVRGVRRGGPRRQVSRLPRRLHRRRIPLQTLRSGTPCLEVPRIYRRRIITGAAYRQGQASVAALLDEYPEAVVILLPGELHRMRRLGREYMRGFSTRWRAATRRAACIWAPNTLTPPATRFPRWPPRARRIPLIAKLASPASPPTGNAAARWRRACGRCTWSRPAARTTPSSLGNAN